MRCRRAALALGSLILVVATGCTSAPGAFSFSADEDPFVGLRRGMTVEEAFRTLDVTRAGTSNVSEGPDEKFFVRYGGRNSSRWAMLKFQHGQLALWTPSQSPLKSEVPKLERVDEKWYAARAESAGGNIVTAGGDEPQRELR